MRMRPPPFPTPFTAMNESSSCQWLCRSERNSKTRSGVCGSSRMLSIRSMGSDNRTTDVLALTPLLPELPIERTQLLDNLGRIRREVGPITPELSDALADAMNLRRGDVHEVVSFYSFLRVPMDVVRVCTGPVCDCVGATRDGGAGSRLPRPLRPRPGAAGGRGRSSAASPTGRTASCSSRTSCATCRSSSPDELLARLEASGLTGMGGAGFPAWRKWEAVRRRASAACRDRERRRGRARDVQGPLPDGAPAAARARGARRGDALLRDRPARTSTCARNTRTPVRGCRRRSPNAGSPSRSSSAPARTSAARSRRCSSRWRAAAGCRAFGRRSRPSTATSASPR